MSKLFLYIYDRFQEHKGWFYTILIALICLLAAMASQITLQENITNHFRECQGER